jgi:hypothetical protein
MSDIQHTAASPTSGSARCKPGTCAIFEGRAILRRSHTKWHETAIRPLPSVLSKMDAHKGQLSLLLSLFLILKVVTPVKGDVPTALAILQSASLVPTILGALLSGLPLLAVTALIIAIFNMVYNRTAEGWALALAAFIICFFISPWRVLTVGVISAAIAGLCFHRTTERDRGLRLYGKRAGQLISIALITIIGSAALWTVLYSVWLPHEAVVLTSGRTEVGYVINQDGTGISILRSGQRRLVRYPDKEFDHRFLCFKPARGLFNTGQATSWTVLNSSLRTSGSVPQQACPPNFKGNPYEGPEAPSSGSSHARRP